MRETFDFNRKEKESGKKFFDRLKLEELAIFNNRELVFDGGQLNSETILLEVNEL